MTWKVSNIEALTHVADEVLSTLTPNPTQATVLGLSGELGAGKTAFTKELAKQLGITEHITSPTFVLAKEYPLQNQKFERLIHIDAYRLEEGETLEPVGFAEHLAHPENLIVVEWPERVEQEMPSSAQQLTFEVHEDGSRTISYE